MLDEAVGFDVYALDVAAEVELSTIDVAVEVEGEASMLEVL